MLRIAHWYFDFISPFAYLQWQRIKDLQAILVDYRPLLFAGLLDHFGHVGPAEIAQKRLFTYRHVQWRADRAGIPLCFPPAHPFNPLAALRLCLAADNRAAAIDATFNFIWREGKAVDTPDGIQSLADRLGLGDAGAILGDAAIKARLKGNLELALEAGVFGVPSLVLDGQVFWGEDATDMFLDYQRHPQILSTQAMRRLETLPIGAARPRQPAAPARAPSASGQPPD